MFLNFSLCDFMSREPEVDFCFFYFPLYMTCHPGLRRSDNLPSVGRQAAAKIGLTAPLNDVDMAMPFKGFGNISCLQQLLACVHEQCVSRMQSNEK